MRVESEDGAAWSHPKTFPNTVNLVHTSNYTTGQASQGTGLLPGLSFQGKVLLGALIGYLVSIGQSSPRMFGTLGWQERKN